MPYDTEALTSEQAAAAATKAEIKHVLERAKQAIREHGHAKHIAQDSQGRVCTLSAIALGEGRSGFEWLGSPSRMAVALQVETESRMGVCSWNNLPTTRAEDVIALFDRTIASL